MNYFAIGEIIREFRTRANIKQAQLCEGLCEPPTLCKIENGRQNPNKKLLDALIEKLQIPITLNVVATKQELERCILEKEISNKIYTDDFDNIQGLLEQYEKISPEMNKFEKQYLLYAKSAYAYQVEAKYKETLSPLIEAMKLTFPNYEIECDIQEHLFTSIEFSLLNSIAICLHGSGQIEKGIGVLEKLAYCLEKRYSKSDMYINKYPTITYNLSSWLGLVKQWSKSLVYTQKSIDCCIKQQNYFLLADLYYNHGFTLVMLGKTSEGTEYLRKSLTLGSLFKNHFDLSLSIADIKEHFGEDFYSAIATDTGSFTAIDNFDKG